MRRVLKVLLCVTVLIILASLLGTGGSASWTATGDLDGNGEMERYLLSKHRLTVYAGDALLWQSPREWRVDSFALGDVNNDGTVNLVMSLWKRGNFGPVKPFWEDGPDRSYKNHLFVYNLTGDTLHPVWCSSDLDHPIASFEIRDVDGDGLNELVVEEGSYRRIVGERYALDGKAVTQATLWRWDRWGFSQVVNSEMGADR